MTEDDWQEKERIEFEASIAPLDSGIKVGQSGARVQIDIPESEMPSIVRLLLMRGKPLKITVEEVSESLSYGSTNTTKPRTKRHPFGMAGG